MTDQTETHMNVHMYAFEGVPATLSNYEMFSDPDEGSPFGIVFGERIGMSVTVWCSLTQLRQLADAAVTAIEQCVAMMETAERIERAR